MLKISDFAQIAQVSVSTLRYYDEIGLFKPVTVEPVTGYRFYTVDQLVQLNRILALKDLGVSLPKIAQLLYEEVAPDDFHTMLRMRQAQLKQTIHDAQEQLARIEARIDYIEQEGCSSLPEVVVKTIEAQSVISSMTRVEGFILNLEYAQRFAAMLRQHNLKPTGYTHYIYHSNSADNIMHEIELAVPVANHVNSMPDVSWSEVVSIRQLPFVPTMASVVYHGSPYTLSRAYQALGTWIQRNQYSIAGPCRKCCLRWSGDLESYITEVQFPVELSA